MVILVLQGPNFNLLGTQAARSGEQVTLDKVNSTLRKHALRASPELQLRFLQTHKADQALSFIQRNRKKAAGLLLAPAAWARYEYALLDALRLVMLPSIQVLLTNPYGSINTEESIFTPICNATVHSHPDGAFNDALNALAELID